MKYTLTHKRYPQPLIYLSGGGGATFSGHVFCTDDPEVARELSRHEDIELTEGTLPKPPKAVSTKKDAG